MPEKIIQWDIDAWNDYVYWQTQDRKTLKRINLLIKDISRSPFEGKISKRNDPVGCRRTFA